MNLLGISMDSNSSAAYMMNNEIVSAVSEERYNKIKNYAGYPKKSVEYCSSVVKPDKILFSTINAPPLMVLAHKPRRTVDEKIDEMERYWLRKLYMEEKVKYHEIFPEKIDYEQYPGRKFWEEIDLNSDECVEKYREMRKRIVSEHLDFPLNDIDFIEHHLAHSMYAYYASPFRDVPVLSFTADGWGDYGNASLRLFTPNGHVEKLMETSQMTLGRLYRFITLILNMKPWEHEYKVMGLAPYSVKYHWEKPYKIFKELLEVDGMNIRLKDKPRDYYFYFKERLKGCRFDGIAGGIQRYAEEILVKWVSNAINETGVDHVVFSGGVAMNCKAMMEISKIHKLKKIFVPPSGSDESLAIGVCYAKAHEMEIKNIKPLKTIYLGPDYHSFELSQRLKNKYKYMHIGLNPRKIAFEILKGKIISLHHGRMEFGARALGNRSIIADPRKVEIVKKINRKIKKRDFWMPFCPSILHERVNDYLLNPKGLESPFMTMAFETTKEAQKDIIATLHPADYTCRPQIIKKEENPFFYSIIKSFEHYTGVGALLNTSFNLHGYPIVNTPEDALHVFEQSKIDSLFLGDNLFTKEH